MEIIPVGDSNETQVIERAVTALRNDRLVIYPTETCYGIGAIATSTVAISTLLQYKKHRADKPISIAVCDKHMATEYAELNAVAQNICDHFLPGPITVVARGRHKVAPHVESPKGTIGIRIPDYPLVLKLIKKLAQPITATSANVSYKKTPYKIEDVLRHTSTRQQSLIALAIDAGQLPRRKPSVVVDTTLENVEVLRAGDIDFSNFHDFIAHSEDETRQFVDLLYAKIAAHLGKKLVIIAFYGDLGTGKTFITRHLGQKIGVQTTMVSPTFILCREYQVQHQGHLLRIYHIDTYRMYEAEEMEDLRCHEMFDGHNVVIIEWAGKVRDYIRRYADKAVVVHIVLEHVDETTRHFKYTIAEKL